MDVYRLDEFIAYMTKQALRVSTIKLAVAALRSYFQKYDIHIIPCKLKHKVTLPPDLKGDEYALGIEEIRQILTSVNNRKLKAFCLILASAGVRPVEGLAIRYKDIDFQSNQQSSTYSPTIARTSYRGRFTSLPRERNSRIDGCLISIGTKSPCLTISFLK